MKTRLYHASWLSLIEAPHGLALQIFDDQNDTMIPNAVVFMTGRQLAGLRRQKPLKLKNLKGK